MSEIGIAEIFGMVEAIALIGTLFVILYFSRKQAQRRKNIELALKIEEDIANYLDVLKFISAPSLPNLNDKVAPQLEDQEIPPF